VHNCTVPNPPDGDLARREPWAVLTGGQRDDVRLREQVRRQVPWRSAPTSAAVTSRSTALNGKNRTNCGSGVLPCAIFDLDESGGAITSPDLAVYRGLTAGTGTGARFVRFSARPERCARRRDVDESEMSRF
jgi:hypothetical protein